MVMSNEVPNGLNHSLRVFTCDFKVEANERDSFEKFLARHEGYKSFLAPAGY